MQRASNGLSTDELAALAQIAKGDKKTALPAGIIAKLILRGLAAVSGGLITVTAAGIDVLASAGSKQ